MHTTYINDLMDCAYPFVAGVAYPFPLSLIKNISLCLHAEAAQSQSLRVTSISISNSRVFVVVEHAGCPLGYFDVDASNGNKDGVFKAYGQGSPGDQTTPRSMGYITLGDIPTDDARYEGSWLLDPSCVNFMVVGGTDMYSFYSQKYMINGIVHEFGKAFSITTGGCLDMRLTSNGTTTTAELNVAVDALGNWQTLYNAFDDTTEIVESINNIAISELGPNKVYRAAVEHVVLDNSRRDVYISLTRQYMDQERNKPYFVALTLTGTKDYRTCPGLDRSEDNAYTPDEFYPKEP